jgi:RNA polymerase I-specific transcription initiation factor RRN3
MALRYLLRLIPSASSTLAPILSSRFPSSDDSKKIHVTYIHNLIEVTGYATELKSEIFALITERLVKIDVEMQVDLDDLDDELASAIVQGISLQAPKQILEEEEDSDDSDADSVLSDDSLDEDESRIKELQANVEKMDAILDILFSVYTPAFSDPNSIEADSIFGMLLEHFSNIILPTYRSRHTQFLLFHFAQRSPELVDAFTGVCAVYAFDASRPAVLRQSSAAYLASFVARGAHVEPLVVRTMFDYIVKHLDEIRHYSELNCRGPDLRRYSIFYAMTQALLYIFCFRWRDLVDNPEALEDEDPASFSSQDLIWMEGVKEALNRAVYSKLNPLKVCSPPIVEEFAKIAHHLHFMYVYPLLEQNKRIRLSQFLGGAGGSGTANPNYRRETGYGTGAAVSRDDVDEESWYQLDAYFPFDPYQLPLSKRWIEGDYVAWRGIPGLDAGGDDSEGSGSESEDDEIELEEVEESSDEDDE